jgi:hypothetical protein
MSEYMHLVGAEQVQSAANSMKNAAEEMQRAAANMEGSLERHRRWADDWLQTFERVLADSKP